MNEKCMCHTFTSKLFVIRFCPDCGRQLIANKLQPTGDAYRDRLIAARLAVRSDRS